MEHVNSTPGSTADQVRAAYAEGARATIAALLVSVTLATMKVAAGIVGNSYALGVATVLLLAALGIAAGAVHEIVSPQTAPAPFTLLVLVACALAFPVSWFVMNRWLESFAYRVGVNPGVFILTGILALMIAFVTVSTQAYRAASLDPVKSLRYD